MEKIELCDGIEVFLLNEQECKDLKPSDARYVCLRAYRDEETGELKLLPHMHQLRKRQFIVRCSICDHELWMDPDCHDAVPQLQPTCMICVMKEMTEELRQQKGTDEHAKRNT